MTQSSKTSPAFPRKDKEPFRSYSSPFPRSASAFAVAAASPPPRNLNRGDPVATGEMPPQL